MKINERRSLGEDYFESDKDYVLNNLRLCVQLLDERVKKSKTKSKHSLAHKAEYRDSYGRLPHSDWCRSNRMEPCDCGRGI